MYKKNDIVLVYSLQSFWKGGFLDAEPAIVRQDQIGKSVIVMVVRNFGDRKFRLDSSYEVYEKQAEIFCSAENMKPKELKRISKLFTRIYRDREKRYEKKIYTNSRTCTKKATSKFAEIMCRCGLKANGFTYEREV